MARPLPADYVSAGKMSTQACHYHLWKPPQKMQRIRRSLKALHMMHCSNHHFSGLPQQVNVSMRQESAPTSVDSNQLLQAAPVCLAAGCGGPRGMLVTSVRRERQQKTCEAIGGVAYLLLGEFVGAVDGGVEHFVAAVGQGAHGVEKQLGAVLAHNGHRPVPAAPRAAHLHVWPAVLQRPALPPPLG